MGVVNSSYRIVNYAAPKKAVDPMTERIANEVMRAARARTPVGKTGALIGGWKVQKLRTAGYRVINDVFYARFLEHGTRKMRPKPMLGPAVLAARQRYGR